MQMDAEATCVIAAYREHFGAYADRKLAIYGIGGYTRAILENADCANVVCLLDESRAGEDLYGKPILTPEEAHARGVELIVIVARAANVGIIYRRIAAFCRAHGIRVLNLDGKEPGPGAMQPLDISLYADVTLERLKERIDQADTVSFDVFDTLLYRDVLYPRDIFCLLARQAGGDFYQRRVAAEARLHEQGPYPTLQAIYDAMGGEYDPRRELAMERAHLFRKESGFQAFSYALARGKRLFLVSDMYVSGDFLHEVLTGMGYAIPRENVLVSCEFGVSKHHGLFAELKRRASGRVLHVGDNREADITCARNAGIDDAFCLPNALEMLEHSTARGLLAFDRTLEQRLLLGRFLVTFLQDSFLFSTTQGKIAVRNNEQLAALVAPFACWLYAWVVGTARELGLERVLLSSRDGWLLAQLDARWAMPGGPQLEYLYVSRAVAVLASIRTDADIAHAARLPFNGDLPEMLRARFHLEEADIREHTGARGEAADAAYILLHRAAILRQAAALRQRYQRYLQGVQTLRCQRAGLFDFISSGTCQKALAGIVETALVGLYAGHVQVNTGYKPETAIYAALGAIGAFDTSRSVYQNYFLLESIFSSPEATVADFTEDGRPLFEEERRAPQHIDGMLEVQAAICAHAAALPMGAQDMRRVDVALVDMLYGLLREEYSLCSCTYFDGLHMYDSFCQRGFSVQRQA